MMGVVIKRNVILRSIVTEQLKEQLKEELQRNIDEIDQQIRQIDFRTQPYITELQRSNIQQAMAVRGQIEQEKERQRSVREARLERMKEVEELEVGEEVIRGTLESQVEVEEGDNLAEVLGGREIVTKDDVVVEIRQHVPSEEEEAPAIITTQASQTRGEGDLIVPGS